MIDSVKYAVCTVCLVTAFFKGLQYRRTLTTDIAGRYVIACLILFGTSAFLIAPTPLTYLSSVEPVPYVTRWFANSLIVGAGWCIFAILTYTIRDPARTRRFMFLHTLVAVIVVSLMATLLLIISDAPFSTEFMGRHGNRWPITMYLAIFSVYVSSAFLAFILLIRKYSTAAPERSLRTGLRIMMLGAVAGLMWAAWKSIVLVINRVEHEPVRSEPLVTAILSSTAAILIAVGGIGPIAMRWLNDKIELLIANRHRCQLTHLWTELSREFPDIELSAAHSGLGEFGVYRLVIEIRDASLALQPYMRPEIRHWATEDARRRRLTEEQVEVVVEACSLAAGLVAHAAGTRFNGLAFAADTMRVDSGDIAQERDWLIRVSRAFARDVTVRKIRQRALDELRSTSANSAATVRQPVD